MNSTLDLAAYRVAFGFTFVYAALIVAAWASGSEALQYPRQMLSLAVLSALVVNVGFPAFVTAAKDQLSRTIILKRAGPLVVAAAAMSWAIIYYSVTYLFQSGLPAWAAWLVGIILSGIATMLASLAIIGAPKKTKTTRPAAYIGALRDNETWLRGARCELPPENQIVYPGQLSVGGIPLDWSDEVSHKLISGATRTGKSVAVHTDLRALRLRSNTRAIILDYNGDFCRRHFRPGDIILNDFDDRSPAWSPFAEMRSSYDAALVAASYVPLIEGPNQEWSKFGRSVLADLLRGMYEKGEKNPQKLYRLLTGPQEELTDYLVQAGLTAWTSPNRQKMMASSIGTILPYISIFERLRPDGNFSVRDWVRNGDGGTGFLFVTYLQSQRELLRQFVSAIADLAIDECLSLTSCEGLPDDQHRRLFFILDELDSIGNISKLEDGVTKLGKYGGVVEASIQTLPQLEKVYGEKLAASILGNIQTYVILRAADGATAKVLEDTIGRCDIERRITTVAQTTGNSRPGFFSAGHAQSSTGKTLNEQIQVDRDRPVIMAADLQSLPRLCGVLVQPNSPRHPFKLKVVKMPEVVPPFVERKE